LLGINEKEISPNDIYKAMNSEDRDTYDSEVTGLRKLGILIEIRTNSQALLYSKINKIAKQKVPRFKIKTI
jgi:ATP-dependent DNA helicase RecG